MIYNNMNEEIKDLLKSNLSELNEEQKRSVIKLILDLHNEKLGMEFHTESEIDFIYRSIFN